MGHTGTDEQGEPLRRGSFVPADELTHDYRRNGTTTLFAALNVLNGQVIAECRPRHRHQEFLRFLRRLDREVPKELDLPLILDNYQTHKHEKVRRSLAWRRRFHFHFIPTSSSVEPGGAPVRGAHQQGDPSRVVRRRPGLGADDLRVRRALERERPPLRLDRDRRPDPQEDQACTGSLRFGMMR